MAGSSADGGLPGGRRTGGRSGGRRTGGHLGGRYAITDVRMGVRAYAMGEGGYGKCPIVEAYRMYQHTRSCPYRIEETGGGRCGFVEDKTHDT